MNRIGAQIQKWHMIDVELHVGQDMPELKPVETGPLPPQTTGVASLVIETGTIRGENRSSPLEAHEFSRGRMSRQFVLSFRETMRLKTRPFVPPDQLVKQKEPRTTNSSRRHVASVDAEERPVVRTRRARPVESPRLHRTTCLWERHALPYGPKAHLDSQVRAFTKDGDSTSRPHLR